MLRLLSSATALALAASGVIALHLRPPSARPPASGAGATPYALSAFGIGTAVKGGEVPVGSGKTAYRIIGCTNRAPVERENHEAEADVPGLGTVSGVKTDVWTTSKNGVVASNAVQRRQDPDR